MMRLKRGVWHDAIDASRSPASVCSSIHVFPLNWFIVVFLVHAQLMKFQRATSMISLAAKRTITSVAECNASEVASHALLLKSLPHLAQESDIKRLLAPFVNLIYEVYYCAHTNYYLSFNLRHTWLVTFLQLPNGCSNRKIVDQDTIFKMKNTLLGVSLSGCVVRPEIVSSELVKAFANYSCIPIKKQSLIVRTRNFLFSEATIKSIFADCQLYEDSGLIPAVEKM